MSEAAETRYGFVRNPLTVIAVFAGLAEVTATIALPQLDPSIQKVFVWFVMAFPTLLVLLFFGVLWFRHHILYAPSDFSDERHFMQYWVPALPKEEEGITEEEVREDEALLRGDDETSSNISDEGRASHSEYIARAKHAERLAIDQISSKLGVTLSREVSFGSVRGVRYDAVGTTPSGAVIVEVKYVGKRNSASFVLRRELERFASLAFKLPKSELVGTTLILVFVFQDEEELEKASVVRSRMRSMRDAANLPVTVELEFLDYEALTAGRNK